MYISKTNNVNTQIGSTPFKQSNNVTNELFVIMLSGTTYPPL